MLPKFANAVSFLQAFLTFSWNKSRRALLTSLTLLQSEGGNKSLRSADNIDLIAGYIDKLTGLASRLTTNSDHLDFCHQEMETLQTLGAYRRKQWRKDAGWDEQLSIDWLQLIEWRSYNIMLFKKHLAIAIE